MTQWNECRGYPIIREARTSEGPAVVEWISGQWARSETGSPLSFRTQMAVTFPDGRRVEWVGLGSYTPGEAVSAALWAETCLGTAIITPAR